MKNYITNDMHSIYTEFYKALDVGSYKRTIAENGGGDCSLPPFVCCEFIPLSLLCLPLSHRSEILLHIAIQHQIGIAQRVIMPLCRHKKLLRMECPVYALQRQLEITRSRLKNSKRSTGSIRSTQERRSLSSIGIGLITM